MSDRRLEVVPLNDKEIDGVIVEGDAFGELIGALGIAPNVLRTDVVKSAKAGDETRGYLVQVHEVPGPDGEVQRIYACTCPAFKYHQLPYPDDIRDDVPDGLADIGTCKHGDVSKVKDRSEPDREDGQGSFDEFGGQQ